MGKSVGRSKRGMTIERDVRESGRDGAGGGAVGKGERGRERIQNSRGEKEGGRERERGGEEDRERVCVMEGGREGEWEEWYVGTIIIDKLFRDCRQINYN